MPKRKVKGGGLVSDIAHGLMKVHGKLREHKPVSKILRILPGLENVRYLGPALQFARGTLGYNPKKIRRGKK